MSTKKSSVRRKLAAWMTPDNVATAVDVGLAILSSHGKTRPYAQMLQTAAALKGGAAPVENSQILSGLRALRDRIKAVSAETPATHKQRRELKSLREQQDALLDLLLKEE